MYLLTYIIISNIYWWDWTNYGMDELLLRVKEKPIVFLGTTPIERKELRHFLVTSTPTDSSGIWVRDRLFIGLQEFEQLEWNVGALDDSFSQQFVLFGKGISAGYIKLFVETVAKFGDSCGYPSKKWQGVLASDYLKGYAKVSLFNFSVAFGREPIKWGPSPRNSLVISGNSPPFDLIRGSYQTTKLKMVFFTTVLNPEDKINRYFSGHRIEYNLWHKLNLGFSEVVLFGGEGKFPSLYHLNPIFLYYPYQWNRKSSENILWGLDFNLFLSSFGVYGELMIDDFPYRRGLQKEHPKIGINFGIKHTLSKTYLLAEYTTTTRWTYNHITPWQRYTYLDFPIGHPIGPDFDELFLGVVHHLRRNVDILANGSLLRKGAGTINEIYPGVFPPEYWLTGELSQASEFEFGIKWYKQKFVLTSKIGCIINKDKLLPKASFFISNRR